MKIICPTCNKPQQSARVTYYIKNGTRVFPRDRKCFTVLRCGCKSEQVIKKLNQQNDRA